MTWFKRVLVTSAIMVPLSAWAFGPRPISDRDADEIAEHLASKLDLDEAVAAEVAERMMASREEGEALKERAREEANLLRSAIEDGDEKAMRASMKELERIKKEGESIREEMHDDLASMLTIEERAKMALMHMERMHRQGEMMRRMKEHRRPERGL